MSRIPAKAIASTLFAIASLFLWRVYGDLHWGILREHYRELPASVRPELFVILSRLEIVYRSLALAAMVWCIWSWRTERRVFAVTATLFTACALFGALAVQ